jgi:8-oxo-dGTP diphosphatase
MGEPAHYDPRKYERPSVTVDVVILTLREGELQVLLIQRKNWPYAGMWAIPGGFVEMDEPLESAARRELAEETGIDDPDIHLEQLYTFGDPGRDPRTRVISVAHLALVSGGQLKLRPASDAADAGWFPAHGPPPLAFDHDQILSCAVQHLRDQVENTSAIFRLLPETFTLTELQGAYEHILREDLDKRNFRRKMLSSGMLEETHQLRSGDHRPAKLYRFQEDTCCQPKAHRLCP